MRYAIYEVHKILRQLYHDKDRLLIDIIVNWQSIVGMSFCDMIIPVRIYRKKKNNGYYNILFVKSTNHAMVTKFLFCSGIIIERISLYMGYDAIHQIKFDFA